MTAFIAVVPKIAVLKLCGHICSFNLPVLTLILFGVALASVAIGAIGAFHQNNLSRCIASSSTAHAGFVLGCLISADFAGVAAAVLSVIIYALISAVLFA